MNNTTYQKLSYIFAATGTFALSSNLSKAADTLPSCTTTDTILQEQLDCLLQRQTTSDEFDRYRSALTYQATAAVNNIKVPIAIITKPVVCDGLTCTLDGSQSSDEDDSFTNLQFKWSFSETTDPLNPLGQKAKIEYNFAAKIQEKYGDNILPWDETQGKQDKEDVNLVVTDTVGQAGQDNVSIKISPIITSTCMGMDQTNPKNPNDSCVTEDFEKSGLYGKDPYKYVLSIPNKDKNSRKIIVYTSGGTETYYPGCAGKGPQGASSTCRYSQSLEPNVIYTQRLVLQGNTPNRNIISFTVEQSDVKSFNKSISWIPGDLKSYNPTIFSSVKQYLYDKWWIGNLIDPDTNEELAVVPNCSLENSSVPTITLGNATNQCNIIGVVVPDKADKTTRVFYANFQVTDPQCGQKGGKKCYVRLVAW